MSAELDLSVGFVYRWTNNVNGMMYIGSHNGSNPRYTGSGLVFRRAVARHGLDNFTREILYVGSEFREREEQLLIEVDAASDPMYYNLKNQAGGLISIGPANPMWGRNDQSYGIVAWAKARIGKSHEEVLGPEAAERIRQASTLNGRKVARTWIERTCPHCGTIATGPVLDRFHFDKCKGARAFRRWRHLLETMTGPIECPKCGIHGKNHVMYQWHFDNCKWEHFAILNRTVAFPGHAS